jgi:hypothetical protein
MTKRTILLVGSLIGSLAVGTAGIALQMAFPPRVQVYHEHHYSPAPLPPDKEKEPLVMSEGSGEGDEPEGHLNNRAGW